MKKQLVKQMLHSTAALVLCAALFTGFPFTGIPARGGNGNNGKPGIITGIPNGEDDNEAWEEPGIAPLSDQPNDVNLLD